MVLKDGSKPKTVNEHRKLFQKDFVLGGRTKWGTRRRMKKPYKGTGQKPASVYWAHLTDDEWKSLPQHQDWKGFQGTIKQKKEPTRFNTNFETEEKIKNQTEDPLVALIKLLASHHVFIRKNAIDKTEKEFLPSLERTTFMDMMKLWKGLFYAHWFSDGLVAQHEDSTQISKLTHQIPSLEAAVVFQQAFWKTMEREMQLIDKWRKSKFLQLMRKQYREWIRYLRGSDVLDAEARDAYQRTMIGDAATSFRGPLSTQPHTLMSSIRLHMIDVFGDEVKNIPNLTNEEFIFLLRPMLQIHIRLMDDSRIKEYVEDHIITPLLTKSMGDFIEYTAVSELFDEMAAQSSSIDVAYEMRKCGQLALEQDERDGSEYILDKMEQDLLNESQPAHNNDNNNNNDNDNNMNDEDDEDDEEIEEDEDMNHNHNNNNNNEQQSSFPRMEIDEEISFDPSMRIVYSHLGSNHMNNHMNNNNQHQSSDTKGAEMESGSDTETVTVAADIPAKMYRLVEQNHRVRYLNRIRRAKRNIMDQLALQAFQHDPEEEDDDEDDDDGEIDYGYEVDPNSDEFKEMEGMEDEYNDDGEVNNKNHSHRHRHRNRKHNNNNNDNIDENNRRVKFNLSANKMKVFHKKKTRVRPEQPPVSESRPGQSVLRRK